MTHAEKTAHWLAPLERAGGFGVEIGAFKTPVPGIAPVYVDRFAEYAGQACLADYFGDATELPFRDNSLDYVVTSHVLEHVANPIAALAEWYRVLRPGGLIYLVVPDRRFTFDHRRPLTPLAHFLQDFERGTTPIDATHIEDFVDGVDWSLFSPATPPAEVPQKRADMKTVYRESVAAGREINIHFHVFEPPTVLELVSGLRDYPKTRFNWELVDQAERFPTDNPNGFLAIVRVKKTWRERAAGALRRRFSAPGRAAALRPDAKPFPPRVPHAS